MNESTKSEIVSLVSGSTLSTTSIGDLTASNGQKTKLKGQNNPFYANTTSYVEEKSEIDLAIEELKEAFSFYKSHEERVRSALENDESLVDNLHHLVIAASVLLSDANKMEDEDIRGYEMGNKVIVEEKNEEGEWEVQRSVGMQLGMVLAHARAKKRMQEIERLIDGLGRDRRSDEIDDILDELDEPPAYPPDDPLNPNPSDRTFPWVETGDPTWTWDKGWELYRTKTFTSGATDTDSDVYSSLQG